MQVKRAAILLLLIWPTNLSAQRVRASVDMFVRESNFHLRSAGVAEYYDALGNQDYTMLLNVQHYIEDENSGNIIAGSPAATMYSGTYLKSVESSVQAVPRGCYKAPLTAVAQDRNGTYGHDETTFCTLDNCCGGGGGSGAYCYTDPETGVQTCSGGGGSGPGGGWNNLDCGYNNVEQGGCASPIVINVENGSYPMSGPGSPVQFDLNADGAVDIATWTAAGSAVGFLALDRNRNGKIDDGAELFGNHTPLRNGHVAANGFEALGIFDANQDGVLDGADPIWPWLLLWVDRNHNGRSEPEELRAVSSTSVRAISLDYRTNMRRDGFGNLFRYEGMVQLSNGWRHIYDVFFRIRQ
jgi:hypothetical protein